MVVKLKTGCGKMAEDPGDEYERTAADAKQLSDQGIVEAETDAAAAKPKRAAKR